MIVKILTPITYGLGFLATSTVQRRLKRYQKMSQAYNARADSIIESAKTFDQMSQTSKAAIQAQRSALLEDYNALQHRCLALKGYRAPGTAILVPALTYIQLRLALRRQKSMSLQRIVENIEADTFYCDIALWMTTPVAYSEDLLGDLNEEYSRRKIVYGIAESRRWYLFQTFRTVSHSIWTSVQRLAAFATLIELVRRWLRH